MKMIPTCRVCKHKKTPMDLYPCNQCSGLVNGCNDLSSTNLSLKERFQTLIRKIRGFFK